MRCPRASSSGRPPLLSRKPHASARRSGQIVAACLMLHEILVAERGLPMMINMSSPDSLTERERAALLSSSVTEIRKPTSSSLVWKKG